MERNIRNRYILVTVLLISFGVILLLRYASIMVFSGGDRTPSSSQNPLERGPILDRNGRIMAIQTELDTVSVWKPRITDMDPTIDLLSEILDRDRDTIRDFMAADRDYVVIQRTITPSQSTRIRELQEEGKLDGVQLEPDRGRNYPERESAAPLIGYVGIDNNGLTGIEYMFNDQLAPPPETEGRSVPGNQVFLTLDLAIQSLTDVTAAGLLKEHQADRVILLVMEAKTGAVLAYSAFPAFDPNHFTRFSADERRNLPISFMYEPGSVLKIFSISSFLELGGIRTTDRFQTSGGYVADDGSFTITDLGDYGLLTTEEIIKYSSNVGAAYASETVEAGEFYHVLHRFGFGEKTNIALNGEERGILASPDRWSSRSQQTIAIGQEIGVTAIQMITAATALANEGILLRPQVVDRIVSPSGSVLQRFGREPVHQVIKAEHADTMLEMMNAATQPDSTARRVSVPGLSISAKTGTAEVFDPDINSYSEEHFLASTLAILPTEDPELIMYLVIDHPRGESIYGGRIAAPALGELISEVAPYWGIEQGEETVLAHSGTVTVPEIRSLQTGDRLPNLIGLSKQESLVLLDIEGIRLYISGSGWVREQNPPAGTPVTDGMSVELTLE